MSIKIALDDLLRAVKKLDYRSVAVDSAIYYAEQELKAARAEVGAPWISVNESLPPIGTDCECRGVFDNIWRVTHWRKYMNKD